MHSTGFIIKKIILENETARETFGDKLVQLEHADYYNTLDVNFYELGKPSLTLKEFKEYFLKQDFVRMFCIFDCRVIDVAFYPTEFYEFYDLPEERENLIEQYNNVYKKAVIKELERLEESDEFEVILIDYHN